LACCATATGERSVPAGVGAPGRGPRAVEEDFRARAGRQEPAGRREPRSGEPARGPQHEVKPADSTDLLPAGRAAHLTAKATSLGQEPKRAGGFGGIRGAARVQGVGRNRRDPSARPASGRARSYKPKAKSRRARRASEAIVGSWSGTARRKPSRRRPCGIPRLQARVPAVAMPMERVRAREWPARPDLTTPAVMSRAKKCDNCRSSSGSQPSRHRGGVKMCGTHSGGLASSVRHRGAFSLQTFHNEAAQ
jgi:hypothetical protein